MRGNHDMTTHELDQTRPTRSERIPQTSVESTAAMFERVLI